MGGDQQEVKEHWCKVCGKSFPCGRSLGGHMRSHLTLSSPAPEADERYARSSKGCITGSRTGYGLRENPKKTWRLSEPAGSAKVHGKICKDCGEVFPTLKSLFDHMRSHYQRPHSELEVADAEEMESERSVEKKGAFLENAPGTEIMIPRRKRKRSRRLASISASSSSASEIDKEQEDAALTLMILSRATDFRSCISEAKETVKGWKGISECRIQHQINGPNSTDSDVPFTGLHPDDTFMKLEAAVDDSNDSDHSWEAAKNSSNTRCLNVSPVDMLPEAHETNLGSKHVTIVSDGDLHNDAKKTSQYECPLCNKTFNSYQSFGGHRASHIRMKGCTGTRTASKKNKSRINAYKKPKIIDIIVDKNVCMGSGSTKKVNKHECPLCFKVFSSSQALGGHKRSHLLSTSKNDAYQQTVSVEQKTALADVLDLNSQAPAEEGSDLECDKFHFRSWWVRSGTGREPLARLVSN